jgi:hypothetical protein
MGMRCKMVVRTHATIIQLSIVAIYVYLQIEIMLVNARVVAFGMTDLFLYFAFQNGFSVFGELDIFLLLFQNQGVIDIDGSSTSCSKALPMNFV